MDNASYGRSRLVADSPLPSSTISFGMTLVLAIACGVAAANKNRNCDGRPSSKAVGAFSALWTILALQLDAQYHLSAEHCRKNSNPKEPS